MKKVAKAIQGLKQILKHPYLLNNVIDDEKNWEKKVRREFGFNDGLPVVNIAEILSKDFNIEVSPYAFLDGSCTPMDLAFLRGIAVRYNVKKYLEIGTWRGESVANIAAVVDHCTTINLPDETMRKAGMTEDYIGMHRHFSGGFKNITHIQADSRDFDFLLLENDFDMVFIDGDHHSESVRSDTLKIFDFIDPKKTIVVWHDYAYNPEKARWSVLHGILSGCPAELHSNIIHVSNTLCAVYLPEAGKYNFNKLKLKPDQKPSYYFKVNIQPVKSNN